MSCEAGTPVRIDDGVLHSYFKRLVNQFFKILPIRERGEESLGTYMRSLRAELLGCRGLVLQVRDAASYLTLLSILEYLIEHPDCPVSEVKREVFKAIGICDALTRAPFDMEHGEGAEP